MIAFFNGEPGVGKTFHGTAYALHALDLQLRVAVSWSMVPPEGVAFYDLRTHDDSGEERRPDLTIRQANDVPGPVLFRFDALQELFGISDCQVFKDEAQNDLGARDWEKLALRTRIWMSEHRHYRTNLWLYTQDYKFVDVYPRRLARYNVYTIARWLNLTLEMPRPDANSETGELGKVDLFGIRVIVRPWKDLDFKVPWPGWWKLATDLSKRVLLHYRTHDPHRLKATAEKKTPDPAAVSRTASPPKLPI